MPRGPEGIAPTSWQLTSDAAFACGIPGVPPARDHRRLRWSLPFPPLPFLQEFFFALPFLCLPFFFLFFLHVSFVVSSMRRT